MPNWCVGDLKVRGKYEDIKKFLENELVLLGGDAFNRFNLNATIEEDDGYLNIAAGKDGLWLKNAYRSCFESDIEFYYENKEDILTVNLGELRTAWGTDTKALTGFSKQYNLDFKIYAYERGAEFNIDFEVRNGDVVKNKERTFKNYVWECSNPEIGG